MQLRLKSARRRMWQIFSLQVSYFQVPERLSHISEAHENGCITQYNRRPEVSLSYF